MKQTNARRLAILAAGTAALALAACQGPAAPEDGNIVTNIEDITEPENVIVMNEMVEPVPVETPTPAPAPLAKEFGNEQTTMEDAEAAGMTARLPRAPEPEATQPVR